MVLTRILLLLLARVEAALVAIIAVMSALMSARQVSFRFDLVMMMVSLWALDGQCCCAVTGGGVMRFGDELRLWRATCATLLLKFPIVD